MGALSDKADDFPCCTPAPAPDYARIAVLQTERAYLDRELVRAGNHSRKVQSLIGDKLTAVDALIQKELNL